MKIELQCVCDAVLGLECETKDLSDKNFQELMQFWTEKHSECGPFKEDSLSVPPPVVKRKGK